MTRHEVTCIRKSDRYNPHERILAAIENRQYEFFVRVNAREVRIIVAVSRYGNEYLKTEADGEQPNNLLSLRECP